MRAYTLAATALTLGVPVKWLDNVLSHHRIPGVLHSRQGVARRITPNALLRLNIAVSLNRGLGIPIRKSVELADLLADAQGDPIIPTEAPSIQLSVSLDELEKALSSDLERALEITPLPKRGRPSHKKKAGRF